MNDSDRGSSGIEEPGAPRSGLFPNHEWNVTEVEPTRLLAAWTDWEPPAPDPLLRSLGKAVGEPLEVLEEKESPADRIAWDLELVGRRTRRRHDLYCQARPDWLERATRHPAAGRCRWVVGLQTQLDPTDPVASYTRLLRTVARAMPWAPLVYDSGTKRTLDRGSLDDLLVHGNLLVPDSWLWNVDIVRDDTVAGGLAWVHSHGLARCGRLEIEALGVPGHLVVGAVKLTDLVAGWIMDEPTPTRGAAFSVIRDCEVVLQPWEMSAWRLHPSAPGSTAHRCMACGPGHVTGRAAICEAADGGGGSGVSLPVRTALELAQASPGSHVVSRAARRRRRASARAMWPEFERTFRAVRSGPPPASMPLDGAGSGPRGPLEPASPESFRVCVAPGTGQPGDCAPERPLWLEVDELSERSLRGRWLEPEPGPSSPEAANSERIEVGLDMVEDWAVVTEDAELGPVDVGALRLLREIRCG